MFSDFYNYTCSLYTPEAFTILVYYMPLFNQEWYSLSFDTTFVAIGVTNVLLYTMWPTPWAPKCSDSKFVAPIVANVLSKDREYLLRLASAFFCIKVLCSPAPNDSPEQI